MTVPATPKPATNTGTLVSLLKKHWYVTLALAISVLAAVLIFLLAFPYAWWKVPNEFDETPYLDASVYEGQESVFIYREKILALAIQNVDAQDPSAFPQFAELRQEMATKVIVYEKFSLGENSELQSKIDGAIRKLEQEANALMQGNYYANYQKIEGLRNRVRSLKRFQSSIRGEFFRDVGDYELVAFKLPDDAGHRSQLDRETIRPLTNLKLLEKQDLESAIIDRLDAKADKQQEALEQKRDEAYSIYETNILNPRRAELRVAFWIMWYRMLVMFVGTVLATGLLAVFVSKIHRTGIKPKSTENLYFATNKSQKIFQWIAFIIVFIAILAIWGQFLLAILFTALGSAMLDLLVPTFFGSSVFDYPFVFLMPNFLAFMAVVHAWFFLLLSEFIWFLSNCYHLTHLKTYGED